MTGRHHIIAGTVTGACVAASIIASGNVDLPVFGVILTTAFGSLFPDIDSSTSKLGSRLKITSKIISTLFGHRGFLHSLFFVAFAIWGLNHLFTIWDIGEYSYLWIGFVVGMINHLICDMCTRGGVPIFYPFYRFKFSFTNMKSGSKMEFIPLIIVCVITVGITIICIVNGTFL